MKRYPIQNEPLLQSSLIGDRFFSPGREFCPNYSKRLPQIPHMLANKWPSDGGQTSMNGVGMCPVEKFIIWLTISHLTHCCPVKILVASDCRRVRLAVGS
ncbi:hypothetical protein NKI15_30725 [Mesorhizobium sp. M0862]|uniref:hypothetical protein n=1 Tax=Mesorhizobium sp. M0862 TaxID=2957015 RepID=UPI0033377A05